MKTILLLLLAGSCGLVCAQTNLSAQKPAEQDVGVHSDHFLFEGKTRHLVYFGNVVATNWQGTLTCERLTIKLPPEGAADSHPTEIDAETNVVVNFLKNNETNNVSSDKAIYAYSIVNTVTNETISFTGHAKAVNSKGWMTGEPLVYDITADRFSGTDFKMVFKSVPGLGNSTNAPSLNLLK